MKNHLTLSYHYDGTPDEINDDFGRLEMSVQTTTRWGKGGFWVQWQDLSELADELSQYPISLDKPVIAQWGYKVSDKYERVLKIAIAPTNATGALKVSAEIADEHDPSNLVQAVFEVHYPDLSSFRQQITQMMKGEVNEAVLTGS